MKRSAASGHSWPLGIGILLQCAGPGMLCLALAGQAQPEPFSTAVFTGSVRIPALDVAPDGAVLAFCEGRLGGGDPGGGTQNFIQVRRSTDRGRTWSPAVRLFDSAGMAFSDPRPLVDRVNGKVFLFASRWGIRCGQNADCPGWDSAAQDIRWRESLDSGKTWSGVHRGIKAQLGRRSWRSINVTPGRGIQLRWQTAAQGGCNGRLIVPNLYRDSSSRILYVTSLYSDDGGRIWQAGQPAPGPADESDMVELSDGRILLSTRGGGRTWFLSGDGGMTWAQSRPSGISITAVDASLDRLAAVREGGGRDRLIFSAPIGPGRVDLGIWMSQDEGGSWAAPKRLAAGASAYSALARLPDGSVGVLYEGAGILFVNFDRSFLETATVLAGWTDPFGRSILGNAIGPGPGPGRLAGPNPYDFLGRRFRIASDIPPAGP